MTIVPIGKLSLQVNRDERQEYLEELMGAIQENIKWIVSRCLEEELDGEVDRLLGRKAYERRKHGKKHKTKVRCSKCLRHESERFRRNGHYRRGLNTRRGRLYLEVPQVKCVCGGNVRLSFLAFRPGQRMWDDVGIEVRLEYGRGASYRQIKREWDEILGQSVGLRTLNQRVLASVPGGTILQRLKKEDIPPVVRVDGIWITVMFPTGETTKDRSGRVRPVKKAKKVPILAAQGVWPASGRTVLLAWMLASGEDHDSWVIFLERLYEMGIAPENGLALLVSDGGTGFRSAYESRYWMVPLQRCIFHKLQNVAKAIHTPTSLDRQTAHEFRTHFLRQAGQIWQADDETEARLRYQAFCQEWQVRQPKAIETLSRDFDQTLTFFAVQQQAAARGETWPAHILRTTSPLERMFREFRRRYRNAILFSSPVGAIATTAQIAARFS